MQSRVLSIFDKAYSVGPAVFPGGPDILQILSWDEYRNYEEVDSRYNYVWQVESALLSPGEGMVKAKQTIKLLGHGLHRKHEVTFAFPLEWLKDVTEDHLAGEHPGYGAIKVPHMKQGYDQAYVHSPGYPTGVKLTFENPVQVRRWSCLPITRSIVEQEFALFEISLWFPTIPVATFAVEQLLLARDEWKIWEKCLESPLSRNSISPPHFNEIPAVPPGSIMRS